MTVDQDKLERVLGRAIDDLGGAYGAALILLGERTGLWAALAEAPDEGRTPAEIARRAGVHERYATEWLRAMVAGGYVDVSESGERYSVSPEVAYAMTDPDGPTLPGACQAVLAAVRAEPEVAERFRTGDGFAWHEHHHELFTGTERFFRPGYVQHLVASWIPALDGVEDRLRAGARAADVGCGHGASTILMAEAFPRSSFAGFDYHEASIRRASEAAREAGLDGNIAFRVASATDYPADGFDLITMFDCLHDMDDPVGAARHARAALAPDGTLMVVEPFAADRLQDNITPVGRLYYAASTLICTPAAMSVPGSPALGAQAGEARLREVLAAAGFSRVRRAAQTPVNLVLEARP